MAVQQGFSFSSDDGGLMQLVAEDLLARASPLPSLVSSTSSELCEARGFEASRSNCLPAGLVCLPSIALAGVGVF